MWQPSPLAALGQLCCFVSARLPLGAGGDHWPPPFPSGECPPWSFPQLAQSLVCSNRRGKHQQMSLFSAPFKKSFPQRPLGPQKPLSYRLCPTEGSVPVSLSWHWDGLDSWSTSWACSEHLPEHSAPGGFAGFPDQLCRRLRATQGHGISHTGKSA